jgi:hypothetical protein
LGVRAVKDSHPTEHLRTATWNSPFLEVSSKMQQQLLAIARPVRAILLELDNVCANEPIAQREIAIDRTSSTGLRASMDLRNRGNE